MRIDDLIDEIYRTYEVIDASGNRHPLNSHIDEMEGNFLSDFISSREDISRTLEVGCAYGLSSLHITKALRGRDGAHHLILDPMQQTKWMNIGTSNLRRAGIDFFELREEPSETALPKLLETAPESFDLIFVDGWHTFDHTLLDLFYANRLIRVGGYIVVDDCTLPSVAKAVEYITKYPCYQIVGEAQLAGKRRLRGRIASAVPRALAKSLIPQRFYDGFRARTMSTTMIALKKVARDERDWNWFESF